jgi:hypothetical protein
MDAAMTAVDALMAASVQAFVIEEPAGADGNVGTDRTTLQPAQAMLPVQSTQSMQSMRPRGRGRRGNHGGTARNHAAAISLDNDLPDDLEGDDDVLPDNTPNDRLLPDALAPSESTPAGTAATQARNDALIVRGLALLTAATGLARPAGAMPSALARVEANRKAAPITAPADQVAISSKQGRHGQAGGDDSADSGPTPAVQGADNPPARDVVGLFDSVDDGGTDIGGGDGAVPLSLLLYLPPLMNRRLETNGVDDALILERAYLREPQRSPGTSAGPPPVTEMTPVPARLPPPCDPVPDNAENRRGPDLAVSYPLPAIIALQRSPRRRWLRMTSRAQAGTRALPRWPSGRQGITAPANLLTSDPRDAAGVECADFWGRGYAMPAALFHPAGIVYPRCVRCHPVDQ